MHEDSKPRGTLHAKRAQATLAIALAAGVIAVGVGLGHHPAGARSVHAAADAAVVTTRQPAEVGADASVPAAADVFRAVPSESAEPTPTF